jgi:hypothetical protein
LRSFDHIALTREIIAQEKASGIDAIKADIALDLDINGIDTIKDDSVTVTHLPTGDSRDFLAHKPKPKNFKEDKLGDIFAWNKNANKDAKHQKLNEVLSNFQGAGRKSNVPASVAEHGMMTGQSVSDQAWSGDDQSVVNNFVTEELYIHTKVFLHCPLLIIAHDCRWYICNLSN